MSDQPLPTPADETTSESIQSPPPNPQSSDETKIILDSLEIMKGQIEMIVEEMRRDDEWQRHFTGWVEGTQQRMTELEQAISGMQTQQEGRRDRALRINESLKATTKILADLLKASEHRPHPFSDTASTNIADEEPATTPPEK